MGFTDFYRSFGQLGAVETSSEYNISHIISFEVDMVNLLANCCLFTQPELPHYHSFRVCYHLVNAEFQ